MADKSDTTQTSQPSSVSAANAFAELQKAGFGAFNWIGTAWLENMSDIGSELMSFIAERVKEDVKTQHAILHCKNANELRKIQTDFIRKAVDQYTTETGKLVEMGSEFVSTEQSEKQN